MKARHGITPIPLPAIQTSPTGIGRLSRETRKAIAALRDRKIIVSGTRSRGGSYAHPWKLSIDDGALKVGFGSIAAERLINSHPIHQELRCYFNSTTPTYLLGDPWNPESTVGEFELVDDTDYGVWLEIVRSSPESQAGFGGDDYDGLTTLPLGPTAQILVSSTHLGPGYWSGGGTIPTFDDDLLYRFIGRVSVDESGNATIIQHLKSDITLSALAYPYGINFPEPV
jgi:hypothetical protein